MGGQRPRGPTLLTPGEQPVFRDPASGLERRSLSPLFPDRHVDFALNWLPAGQRVSFPPHHQGVEEYLHLTRGALTVVVDGTRYPVRPGDTLFYHGHAVHEFHNDGAEEAEFFIVVDGSGAR
jgi:mannose-6-phosphate isomerase-like protein (cupin superfamily)